MGLIENSFSRTYTRLPSSGHVLNTCLQKKMENNNKRKTETVLEQDEPKKIKICSELTERQNSFKEWIQGCEKLNTEFPYDEVIQKTTFSQTDFYQKLPDVLEKDLILFANICPIHVAHEIAKYWSLSPEMCDYSYEQRFLFFILNYYITRKDEKRRSSILIRLMEIAKYYHNIENEKYKQPNSLVSVPNFAQITLAVMDHSNLTFIHPNRNPLEIYKQNIKDNFGFDTIVQQSLYPGAKVITDATLFLSTEMTKAKSVQRYNDLLASRYEDAEYSNTYLKPQVLKIHQKKSDKNIYIVSSPQINLII